MTTVLTLHVLMECCRESQQKMLAACVILKKTRFHASGSTLESCEISWDSCKSYWFISELRTVNCGSGVSRFLPGNSGRRKGCILAYHFPPPALEIGESRCIGFTKVGDFDFDNDEVIFAVTSGMVDGSWGTTSWNKSTESRVQILRSRCI